MIDFVEYLKVFCETFISFPSTIIIPYFYCCAYINIIWNFYFYLSGKKNTKIQIYIKLNCHIVL